jgi:hypothetical protein
MARLGSAAPRKFARKSNDLQARQRPVLDEMLDALLDVLAPTIARSRCPSQQETSDIPEDAATILIVQLRAPFLGHWTPPGHLDTPWTPRHLKEILLGGNGSLHLIVSWEM